MSDEARTLFISPAQQDDAELQVLKNILERNGYEIRDSPIDNSRPNAATNEQHIKSKILAPCIDQVDAVLVVISSATRTRPWVDWAIECAQQQDKRIVGVYVQGGQVSDLPANFQMYGDALVGCWQADRVMDAIEGRSNTLFMPDGETEFPERDIDRFTCGEPKPE
ncbi:TIR domain-containing protein [Archangium gephyra]|uniref:TIR domain-containing protein n=1 Tax=Archangium gephyra TaxID=48 RepID=UPI0035D3DA7F